MERWKPAVGFVGLYECSNRGRIRSVMKKRGTSPNKILKPYKMLNGYLQVSLRRDGKYVKCYVHRLVASAFQGESNLDVNHINGRKHDNRPENLEYVTPRENMIHSREVLGIGRGQRHWNAKLTENDVRQIHRMYADGKLQREIADQFGIQRATVAGILSRRQWGHINL